MTFRDLCSAREPGILYDGFAKDYDSEEEDDDLMRKEIALNEAFKKLENQMKIKDDLIQKKDIETINIEKKWTKLMKDELKNKEIEKIKFEVVQREENIGLIKKHNEDLIDENRKTGKAN